MHLPYGHNLKIYIEGESRGEYLTAVIRHFPAGVAVDYPELCRFMSRRAPGNSPLSTQRHEADIPHFISGLNGDVTDGSPLEIRIMNGDAQNDASDCSVTPRPSHADYAATVKYGGRADLRGGGHFSGRLTAPLCACGGICIQYLKKRNISVSSHILSIGGIYDTPFDPVSPLKETPSGFPVADKEAAGRMMKAIADARDEGDSLGGIVECALSGLPAGLGEHMFASVEERITSAVFAVPGVKGIEFGAGFPISGMKGSEANDSFITDGHEIFTETNNSGGINGGMTNGMPLIFRIAFRPTPTIKKAQKTVNLKSMTATTLSGSGRNDPCFVPRAVPAVEACAAIAAADLLLDLSPAEGTADLRRDIDIADRIISDALNDRFLAVEAIGNMKKNTGAPVFVPSREKEVNNSVCSGAIGRFLPYIGNVYSEILNQSRSFQKRIAPLHTGTGISGGLVGRGLTHTLSPLIHSMIADYGYGIFDISGEKLEHLICENCPDFLNITIPYKKTVIPYLDILSDEAEAVGAVNTVVKDADGKLRGYNTDVCGFSKTVSDLFPAGIPENTAVYVIGRGGASCAVEYVFRKKYDITPVYFTRSTPGTENIRDFPEYAGKNDFVLVNASPCGMYPETEEIPVGPDTLGRCKGVIDLVYNPFRTALVTAAEERHIPAAGGMTMLVYQAIKTADIVLGTNTDDGAAKGILSTVIDSFRNIILIGMPGCGKTTVGRRLAEILGKPFFDTDEDIELRTGMSCSAYIEKYGEKAFREKEHESVVYSSHLHGAVISVGGGAVTTPGNYMPLRESGLVVRLNKPDCSLDTKDRPVTRTYGISALREAREPLYGRFADISVGLCDDIDENVLKIIHAAEIR